MSDAAGPTGVAELQELLLATDTLPEFLHELQYRLDQGPCLTTLRTGEVMLDDGTNARERWPLYRMQGEAAGLGVSLSVPVSHGAQVLAALNLYSRVPRCFSSTERARARSFADCAAGGVAIALKMARRAELTDDLQAAQAGRAVVDQALGIIMGQRRCSADEAFAVLRELSQTGNVKLREVATRLITVTTDDSHAPSRRWSRAPRPGSDDDLRSTLRSDPGAGRRSRLGTAAMVVRDGGTAAI